MRVSACWRTGSDAGLGSKTREERQLSYLRALTGPGPRATYFGPPDPSRAREPFALLHRGVV